MMALPTPKLERWKYSNLPAYVSRDYIEKPLSITYDGDQSYLAKHVSNTITWAQEAYNDMQLWNGLQDVFSLHIPADKAVDNPVHISIEIASDSKCGGHVNIHVEAGSSMTIYEDIDAQGWCVRSMTITLDEGAQLTHIRTGKGNGVVTNLTQIEIAKNAVYKTYAFNTYGSFMRDQIHARLEGDSGECLLSGSKFLKDQQHCDTTILIEHLAPNCHSNQNYRNLLNDQARGVFQGKVHVHQIAQKTDGYQLCNTALLSDRAEMFTKPELEIYADDVQCSHGATTASPDEEPLFYLMARGIPEAQARTMLLKAFIMESLEIFEEDENIYEFLEQKITEHLDA